MAELRARIIGLDKYLYMQWQNVNHIVHSNWEMWDFVYEHLMVIAEQIENIYSFILLLVNSIYQQILALSVTI